MAYRVKIKDYVLEVDTLEEYQGILKLLGVLPEKPKLPTALTSGSIIINQSLSKEEKLDKFYKLVSEASDRSLEILKALAQSRTGLSDRQLPEILGIEGSALGGALGGITKKARDSGLETQDILMKKSEGGYQLTEMMWKFMEEKLPKRRPYPPAPLLAPKKEGAEDM